MNDTSRTADALRTPKCMRAIGTALLLFLPFASMAAPKNVTLDVVTFNYWNRPILDVFIDGRAGDSSTPYPDTGGKTIAGIKLRLGPKRVTWKLDGPRGTPRNGETVAARNLVELRNVPKDAVFLAIHIYPDETVELITSRHYPQPTAKGESMARATR
ncbi:MAG: hypothetical protein AB1437_13725 [Pseudomonadota bacterium]